MNVSGRLAERTAIACLVAAAALFGGLEYQRVFGWNPSLLRLVGAVAIPAGLAIWFSRKPAGPAPLPLSGMISVVCLSGYLLVTGGGPAAVVDSLISGWSRILTTTLPVTGNPALLAFPTLLTWLCTLAGVEIALRARLPQAGFLSPLVLMGSAILFGSRGGGASLLLAGLFCFVLLAAYVVNLDSPGVAPRPTGEPRSRSITQSTLTGVLVAGSCAMLAALWGTGLPLAQANDPYQAGIDVVTAEEMASVNPLARLAGWALAPDQVLFEVASDRPALWRLAVLDRYDPETGWYTDPDLQFFGGVLSPQVRQATVESMDYRVEVAELPGIWLPTVDRPTMVSGEGLLVDEVTGVLVQPGGLEPGGSYSLTSAVPTGSTDCAQIVSSPTPIAGPGRDIPQELMEHAAAFEAATASPCEKIRAIEDYIKQDRIIDPLAPSGSSSWRIQRFLGRGDEGSRGTSEQFASAFALFANAVGMPARVVVGFHPGEQIGSVWRVRAGDAYAYVELQAVDQRWIPFDPSPVAIDSVRPPVPGVLDLQVGGLAEPETGPVEEQAVDSTPAETESSSRLTGLNMIAWLRSAGIAAAGTVALLAVGVLLARRRLRSSRLKGRGARRVIGAWRQAMDEMRGSGVRIPPSSTVSDCVNCCQEAVGPRQAEILLPLGLLANRALFSAESASESSATKAWQLAEEFKQALSVNRSLPAKLRYALDPRVLVAGIAPALAKRPAARGRSLAGWRRHKH